MPGENSNPYRLPCWLASWPTRQWLTFCAQHAQAAHMSIDEACNAAIEDATPTYETTCATGSPVNGNCYGECEVSDATGVTISGSYAVGETVLALAGGCGKIAAWDRIQFSDDKNIYTVKATVETTCPVSLAGYGLEINEPGLFQALDSGATVTILPRGTRDYSQCEFEGWFAVRARKLWHGRNGWGGCGTGVHDAIDAHPVCIDNCNENPAAIAACLSACVAECSGTPEEIAACEAACEASCIADCEAACDSARDAVIDGCCNGCPPCDSETVHYLRLNKIVIYEHVEPVENGNENSWTYTAEREVLVDKATGLLEETVCEDTCTHAVGDCEGIGIDATASWLLGGNWACGPAFSEGNELFIALNQLFNDACESETGSAFAIIAAVNWTATIVTQTDTVISLTLEAINTFTPGYSNTWHTTWTLSDEYTLAAAVSEAYGLLDEWDMSNFVQCPPRPPGSYLMVEGDIYHSPIPFVQMREVGPQAVEVPPVCGTIPACANTGLTPCPYDVSNGGGETIGQPLPDGTGPHYGFYDPGEQVAGLGWNPGWGLPIGATWWTKMDNLENNATDYPAGGWVMVRDGVITVQKWMETKNEDASHNFFRPCGEDDRVTWATDYRAICGRAEIASATLDTGTHILSVVLSEAADYLIVGDKVDFVKYGAAPTFTETVDNGASKLVPDSTGYTVATLTDATHYTIAGVSAVPDSTHVKSHDAPHFQWNDDRRKGDFTWCKEETECIGVTGETTDNACEAGCLPFSPCYPAVAAVLTPDAPEDFGNADIQTLPAEPGNTYRLLWKPRMDEADLLGGEGRVESMCEPPAGAPALPSGVAFAGCGTLPSFRPMRGLGDAVARVAQPIARGIDKLTSKLPVKLRTNVAGCGGCKKRQAALNKAVPFKRKTTL